jgi:hypothetical protein
MSGSKRMGEIVLRAGTAQARLLVKGYGQHAGAPGTFGLSVQYAPGSAWQDLAQAGRFSNGQVSIADEDALRAALAPLGYTMQLVPTPGRGFLHTLVVLYDTSGQMLTSLPADAAYALAATFKQHPNPFQTP